MPVQLKCVLHATNFHTTKTIEAFGAIRHRFTNTITHTYTHTLIHILHTYTLWRNCRYMAAPRAFSTVRSTPFAKGMLPDVALQFARCRIQKLQ